MKGYLWWPVSFAWGNRGFLDVTAWQQVKRAWDSRGWTMTHPHRYSDEDALRVHRAAARRIWHGWEQCTVNGRRMFGWTLQFGRLKVMFGKGRTA